MGAGTSNSNIADFLLGYKLQQQVDDSRFGFIKIYSSRTSSSHIIVKEINLDDEQSIKYYKTRRNTFDFTQKTFITTHAISDFQENFSCTCGAEFNKILIGMEFIERDLEEEIKNRNIDSHLYKENEIWYVLEAIMSMERALQKESDRVHGDLRPSAIFIQDEGYAKFIDPRVIDQNFDAYYKTLTNTAYCPLSPEQMDCQKEKSIKPDYDLPAYDVWCIGMIQLCMAGLHNYQIFYDWNNFMIDKHQLTMTQENIKSSYSSLQNDLIYQCLNFNSSQRITLSTILGYLKMRRKDVASQE